MFDTVLAKYRENSYSERNKGEKFERLIKSYLLTDPKYAFLLKEVFLWNDFFGRKDFGGSDTGIDLVAETHTGEFWAIQCKCFSNTAVIDKPSVDSFLSTSSRRFKGHNLESVGFQHRLWVSTTNKWGPNAEEAIRNQHPPVTRINLYDLEQAPVKWELLDQGTFGEHSRSIKKTTRPHQNVAIQNTSKYFKEYSRGKLIMACGTGKTFTSLRIAENETNGSGLILFLVPSIALLGQSLSEWTADSEEPIFPICICSDARITKQRLKDNDTNDFNIVDLAVPASTNVNSIVNQLQAAKKSLNKGMTVVFSTYQSIDVISKVQKELSQNDPLSIFDLIICDEAHRTTGVTLAESDESAFVKVHDNEFLQGKKRLYMTATPRLFSDDSKSKAAENDAILCSMDDENIYGHEIYRIGFGEAVEKDLLADYKVLILTLSEKDIPPSIQALISNKDSEIDSDDASKLIGCINALSKQILGDDGLLRSIDPEPMKRAVAFCQNIKFSKKITATFNNTTDVYINSQTKEKQEKLVTVSSRHIDGAMNAPARDELLTWLKSDHRENDECRILTNVRCLSEGIDVPSLDAVLFLSARNSQVDVVQSVGRVMRKSPGTNKKYGYIIIPVLVPSNVEPSKALDDNDRFRVVWTVLNALRAHDDRFNAIVNKLELNKRKPTQILVGGIDQGEGSKDEKEEQQLQNINQQLALQFSQLQGIVFAKMVQKVGDRVYWEKWAKDIAQIAAMQVERIERLIEENKKHRDEFRHFLNGLRKNINPSITQNQAVEMLSQHLITRPVFDSLFEGYSFVKNNAISTSMQRMLDLLEEQALEKDLEILQKFYDSVKRKASDIDNAEGRQRIIIELYDKFFKTAFPKMVEQLGIVYTPVEIVDFILNSVNDVLMKEFGRSLSDEDVHILDPFTGTGTFITRLIQTGLIKDEDLKRKYASEIHANEIVLLAYYIAAVNIENAFHDRGNDVNFKAFDGICLTDTFQLGETDASEKLFLDMFPQNSKRVEAQKKSPLKVIIGNPPYSIGQKSANDNAANQSYERLDARISSTYAKDSKAGLNKALYDAYIKAFRWSTDRLDPENGGIIGFVSNGNWLDNGSTDGFRNSLEHEFSSIYVFNLRGNQRSNGELSRKEGGKVFGSGSRTPISITLLVKNPKDDRRKAKIKYYDIGDYLNRDEKLLIVKNLGTILNPKIKFQELIPDEHHDWLNHRKDLFSTFMKIEPDVKFNGNSESVFVTYAVGINTNRDAWCYNYSKDRLAKNITKMLEFYNDQIEKYFLAKEANNGIDLKKIVDTTPSKISWTVNLLKSLSQGKKLSLDSPSIRISSYRPFCKEQLYFDRNLVERPGLNSHLFPHSDSENIVICISPSANDGISVLVTNSIANLHFNGDSQCFPLYYYERSQHLPLSLFDDYNDSNVLKREGISDYVLNICKRVGGNRVSKEDIFNYVYGLLHNKEYREEFQNDLKKMLPRIPIVETANEFWQISKAGKQLIDLHLNYETLVPDTSLVIVGEESRLYSVVKMKFPSKTNKNVIIFNSKITIQNIPDKAYSYTVNGKSAIQWVMERYQVKADKASGIINDPNDWGIEHKSDRYILDLLLGVITLSLRTADIVEKLPVLSFKE
jgi:predicted helicase